MKWIEINATRKLKIDDPVFIKNSEGKFGMGVLIKEEKTKTGIVRTFEECVLVSDGYREPQIVTNITHICKP